MKTKILPATFFLSALCLLLSPSLLATNYTNGGSGQAYNLYNGDTLRVTGGIYHGNINTFNTGAVVIVSAGASFKPDYINSPAGKILNYGTTIFNGIGTQGSFWMENFNLLTVTGDLSLYDGTTQTWNNNITARMTISGSFYMNNTTFTNYSMVTVTGNLSLYTATSNLINKGVININGNFTMGNGVLNNQNRIYTGDFYAWGGQVINEGSISPKGAMTFNSGTNYTNTCLLVTNAGFTNYGNFQNNGLLWVGTSGTASDHFYNSGTFTNSSNAVVKTVKLTNYNTLAGGGSYYINGDSYSSGTVGKSGPTTDTVKVYDVTRTNTNSIFDVQYGTVNPNVVFRTVAMPDTANVNYSGCSVLYKSDLGTLLPIEWNYFEAKLIQSQAVINWGAQFEQGMKFDVERSYDNANFTTIATVTANNTKMYSITDGITQKNTVVYYRVKSISAANSGIRYTETKMLRSIAANTASLSVYPNPTKEAVTINYQSENKEAIVVRVRTMVGQEVAAKNVAAVVGNNSITINEVTSLKNGAYFIEVVKAGVVVASSRIIKQ